MISPFLLYLIQNTLDNTITLQHHTPNNNNPNNNNPSSSFQSSSSSLFDHYHDNPTTTTFTNSTRDFFGKNYSHYPFSSSSPFSSFFENFNSFQQLIDYLKYEQQVDLTNFLPNFLSLFFNSILYQPQHLSFCSSFYFDDIYNNTLQNNLQNRSFNNNQFNNNNLQNNLQNGSLNNFKFSYPTISLNLQNNLDFTTVTTSIIDNKQQIIKQVNEMDIIYTFLRELILNGYIRNSPNETANFILIELLNKMKELPKGNDQNNLQNNNLDYQVEICKSYFNFLNNLLKFNDLISLENITILFKVLSVFMCSNNTTKKCKFENNNELKIIINDLMFTITSIIPFYKLMNLMCDLTNEYINIQFPVTVIQDIKIKRNKLKRMLSFEGEDCKALVFVQYLSALQYHHIMQFLSSSDSDVYFKFGAASPKKSSTEWIKRVQRLVSALSQYISPEAFEYFLLQEKKLKAHEEKNTNANIGVSGGGNVVGNVTGPIGSNVIGGNVPTTGSSGSSGKKKFTSNFTTEMLHESVILRLIQLLDEKEMYPYQQQSMFTDVSKGIIGKWILFANQLYYLIQRRSTMNIKVLFVGEDEVADSTTHRTDQILSIKKCLELYGDHMKDHFVIWLILQVLPLMSQKSVFEMDPLFARELVRLINDIRYKKYTQWLPLEEELVHYHTMFVINRIKSFGVNENFVDLYNDKTVENWWSNHQNGLDFYTLDELGLKNIFLLSSFLTKPIAEAIINFLKTSPNNFEILTSNILTNITTNNISNNLNIPNLLKNITSINSLILPNSGCIIKSNVLKYVGKRKPLSINFILVLSVHARCRLFEALFEFFIPTTPTDTASTTSSTTNTSNTQGSTTSSGATATGQQNQPTKLDQHLPPSIIELIARIAYCSPSFMSNKLKQFLELSQSRHVIQFIVSELLNYRLVRFFKYYGVEKLVNSIPLFTRDVGILYSSLGYQKFPPHRLYLTLENFMLKTLLYLVNDISKLCNFLDKTLQALTNNEFSETIKRILTFSATRTLKLACISRSTQIEKAKSVLSNILKTCLSTVEEFAMAHSRYRLYPDFIKKYFSDRISSFGKSAQQLPFEMELGNIKKEFVELTEKKLELYIQTKKAGGQAPNLAELQSEEHLKYLLCAVWNFLFKKEDLKDEYISFFKKLLLILISPKEYNNQIYRLVNYILDIYLSDKVEEDIYLQIQKVADLLSSFIWTWELVPLETIILALMDRAKSTSVNITSGGVGGSGSGSGNTTTTTQSSSGNTTTTGRDGTSSGSSHHYFEHTHAISLITYLLTKDNRFLDRVEFFLSLKVNPNHFEEEDYYEKHLIYHQIYPETFGITTVNENIELHSKPCYYGNVCLRMIPILDLLCRRLVELNEFEALSHILDKYGNLFAYHECLVTFVRELLLYFHPEVNADIKMKLFQLLHKFKNYNFDELNVKFTNEAQEYFIPKENTTTTTGTTTTMTVPSGSGHPLSISPNTNVGTSSGIVSQSPHPEKHIFDHTYFLKLVTYITEVLPTIQDSRANHNYITPKHVFYEFPTTFEMRLNVYVVEIMSLPLNLKEIVNKLIDCVIHNIDVLPTAQLFKNSYTVGLILASLPQKEVGSFVFSNASNFLIKNPYLLLVNDLDNTHEKQTIIKTPAECMLCILHTFLHCSSFESFTSLKKVLKQFSETTKHKLETREQFYFICRIIGPFVHHLQTNSSGSSSTTHSGAATSEKVNQILELCFISIIKLFFTMEWEVSLEIRPTKKRKYATLLSPLFQQIEEGYMNSNNSEDEMIEQIFYLFQHIFHILYTPTTAASGGSGSAGSGISGSTLGTTSSSTSSGHHHLESPIIRSKQKFLQFFNNELEKCSNVALRQRLKKFFE
ncbi:hypothetical protein ABK040_011215 [Willaertia magna]